MRAHKSSKPEGPEKAAWQAPTVTKLAISTETKAAQESCGKRSLTHPQPPAAPGSKLGLDLEMAFPLSSRFGND